MKKLYFLAAAALLSVGAFAQTNVKVALPKSKTKTVIGTKVALKKSGEYAPMTVTGGLYSLNNYVAGTTMDLNFVLELDNQDAEYGDCFTINSVTPNDSIGVAEAPNPTNSGCPDSNSGTKEPFNGINGQTISWGNNDDCYGGLSTTQFQGSHLITINVTIDANVTGIQTGDLFVSGDLYPSVAQTPGPVGDLSTTFQIKPLLPVSLTNLASVLLQTENTSACGLTTDNLAFFVKNTGMDTIFVGTAGDSVEVTVNGVASREAATTVLAYSTGAPVAVVAPGDTAVIIALTAVNLSSPGTTYTVDSKIDFVGSGDSDNTDDAGQTITITNIAPTSVATSAYTENFGTSTTAPIPTGWVVEDADTSGVTWGIASGGVTGAALRAFENNTPGTSNDWAFSGCFDFEAGYDYKISYSSRLTSGYNGTLSIALMDGQSSADVNTVITPAFAPGISYATYADTFVVASTGVYYLGFNAVNTDPANDIALRIDDINVSRIGVTSAKAVNKTAVKVYPNPNNGVFTVSTPVASNMEVINVLGSVVYSAKVNVGNNNVNLTGLTPGTYFVKVNNQVSRVIVK
jgi:hypothetical protein